MSGSTFLLCLAGACCVQCVQHKVVSVLLTPHQANKVSQRAEVLIAQGWLLAPLVALLEQLGF